MKRKEDLLKKMYHLSHSLLIKSRECSSTPGFNEDYSPQLKPNCGNQQKRCHLNFITEAIPVKRICGILQLGAAARGRAHMHVLGINSQLGSLGDDVHPVA